MVDPKTPTQIGKWFNENSPRPRGTIFCCIASCRIPLAEKTSESYDDRKLTQQSNARLIAAAPEMLDALNAIILVAAVKCQGDEAAQAVINEAGRILNTARGEDYYNER